MRRRPQGGALAGAAALFALLIGADLRADDALPAGLNAESAEARVQSWRALEGGAELLDPASAAIAAEQDPAVRAAGRDAIGRLALSEADLIDALGGAEQAVARAWAAYALGRYRTQGALDALIGALEDPDESVRREVILSLGRLGDRQALPHLTRSAVRDPSAALRRAAEEAAMSVASGRSGLDVATELALLEGGDLADQLQAARTLGESGDWRAVEPLISAARDGDPELRQAALLALGHLGDHRAVPALIEIAGATAGQVRYHAIAALAWLADESARPALEEMLVSPDPTTRQLSVRALAWTGGADTVPRIAQLLSDPSELVRTEVVLALGELREPARVDALILALNDPSPFVRAEAARLLTETSSDRAGPALLPLLSDRDLLVRLSAAAGLGALGEVAAIPALERLYQRAKDEERELYGEALRALGGM